ncbi:MAG: 30S ribosomal protein S20 [Bacillota bacterium]
MANIRSSEKDIRRSEKRRVRNLEVKSAVRTYIRRFRAVATTGDESKKQDSYKMAQAMIDKAVTKGVLKATTAARYKSRLATLL